MNDETLYTIHDQKTIAVFNAIRETKLDKVNLPSSYGQFLNNKARIKKPQVKI